MELERCVARPELRFAKGLHPKPSCGFTQTMSDLFVLVLMDHHWLQHVQGEGLPTMSLHFYKETADILEVANTC